MDSGRLVLDGEDASLTAPRYFSRRQREVRGTSVARSSGVNEGVAVNSAVSHTPPGTNRNFRSNSWRTASARFKLDSVPWRRRIRVVPGAGGSESRLGWPAQPPGPATACGS